MNCLSPCFLFSNCRISSDGDPWYITLFKPVSPSKTPEKLNVKFSGSKKIALASVSFRAHSRPSGPKLAYAVTICIPCENDPNLQSPIYRKRSYHARQSARVPCKISERQKGSGGVRSLSINSNFITLL